MRKFILLLLMFFGATMYAQKSNEYTVSTTIEFVKNTDVIVQNENY